jgi:hypothetical protein
MKLWRYQFPMIFSALLLNPAKDSAMATEEPQYAVIKTDGDFEIRRYAPYIVAETVVTDADQESGTNVGFRRLAGFIFGNNRTKESIEMTAPVTTTRSEKIAMTAPVETSRKGDDVVMAFMMPSQYTLETLPEPTDSGVLIRQVPERVMAVLKFSGSWSEERFQEQTGKLQEWLRKHDVKAMGAPVVARYNAPWTPWFMRRNEIQIEVTGANAP